MKALSFSCHKLAKNLYFLPISFRWALGGNGDIAWDPCDEDVITRVRCPWKPHPLQHGSVPSPGCMSFRTRGLPKESHVNKCSLVSEDSLTGNNHPSLTSYILVACELQLSHEGESEVRSLGLLKVAGGEAGKEVSQKLGPEWVWTEVELLADLWRTFLMIKISPCFLTCHHMPFSLDFSTIRKQCITRDLPWNCFLPSAPEWCST